MKVMIMQELKPFRGCGWNEVDFESDNNEIESQPRSYFGRGPYLLVIRVEH